MSHEQLLFTWSTFRDSGMGTKLKCFWKPRETMKYAKIFSQKHVSRTITFHMIQISLFWHGYKVEIILENSWNCEVRRNLFTKTCLTNKYFSRDPYFVILTWVQNWNYFEKLMKLGSLPNSFHENMSHKQFHITGSIFCDSSMGTKLKYFWITYETEKSAWIFDKNITHEQIYLPRSTFRDSSICLKLKYFWIIHETLKSDRIFSQKHISRTNTFHVTHISWFW